MEVVVSSVQANHDNAPTTSGKLTTSGSATSDDLNTTPMVDVALPPNNSDGEAPVSQQLSIVFHKECTEVAASDEASGAHVTAAFVTEGTPEDHSLVNSHPAGGADDVVRSSNETVARIDSTLTGTAVNGDSHTSHPLSRSYSSCRDSDSFVAAVPSSVGFAVNSEDEQLMEFWLQGGAAHPAPLSPAKLVQHRRAAKQRQQQQEQLAARNRR
jgi:hypothetical protein